MKTTILLFLLSSTAFGQGKVVNVSPNWNPYADTAANPWHDPLPQDQYRNGIYIGSDSPIAVVTYESLISDWKAYQKECFADSEKSVRQIPHAKCICTEEYWTHRVPTLDGFFEFIGRRWGRE